MVLYGNFEKDLNRIIENKIVAKNNFNKNYINFLMKNDKKLHRGTTKEKFKALIRGTFNKEITEMISHEDWTIYSNFMDFRHAVAHSLNDYQAKKNLLLSNLKSTDELLRILEDILIKLDNIKIIKKVN